MTKQLTRKQKSIMIIVIFLILLFSGLIWFFTSPNTSFEEKIKVTSKEIKISQSSLLKNSKISITE